MSHWMDQNTIFIWRFRRKQLTRRRTILKLIFLCNWRHSDRCRKRYFELYTHDKATFSFLCDLHKLEETAKETWTGHCINLYWKLNSDLHKTDSYEALNSFRKIVAWWFLENHQLQRYWNLYFEIIYQNFSQCRDSL